MSSREFSEWMQYAELEPFGPLRDNLHAGMVAATMANAWRDKKHKAVKPTDFLLPLDFDDLTPDPFPDMEGGEPEPDQEWEDDPDQEKTMRMLGMVEMLNAAYGGKDLRKQ